MSCNTYLYIILFFSISVALRASDELAFDLRPETVVFEMESYHLAEGQVPRLVEQTLIGRFYTKSLPIITAKQNELDLHLSPFNVLEEMLYRIENKKYDELGSLYSPSTRDVVVSRLNDAQIRPKILEWFSSVHDLSILGYWIESSKLLIVYVQVNEGAGGVRPYLFEFSDGWYLHAGHLDSKFSQLLDGFYTKRGNDDLKVVFPPSAEAMSELLSDFELMSFASSIGLNF